MSVLLLANELFCMNITQKRKDITTVFHGLNHPNHVLTQICCKGVT